MDAPATLEIGGLMLGSVRLSSTVLTTWGVMLALGLYALWMRRRLTMQPRAAQAATEAVITLIDETVSAVLPAHAREVLPFLGTLWLFLLAANLVGLIPGLHSPTRDLSATAALAILVFLSVHWFGVRTQGIRRYLRHYLLPNPILLPFHLISEVTRTVALAVRLFGNMLSLETAAVLILLVAGFLAPVPILMLHVVEAIVQAYIFGMLALIYVASAIQSQEMKQLKEE